MSLIGERIRSYRVLHLLGKGGMGEVYVAFDETLERRVALKSIRADRRLAPTVKARFLREARILSRLDHPNICRIHDYIEEARGDFLVLELIDGQPLHSALRRGIDPPLRMEIAERLADVLVKAHEAGVVHRDLKPPNVMLTPGGEIKVLDFGLARSGEHRAEERELEAEGVGLAGAESAGDEGQEETIVVSEESAADLLTQMGQVMGTPTYMSPEQARGEPVTAASDMYSLGLILQELFTGEPANEPGQKAVDLLHRARHGETRAVTGLDRDVTGLINRLKHPVPTARPTALDTLERLRWIRQKPKRRLRIAAVAAVVILALLAGLKYTTDLRREKSRAVAAREEADRRRAQAEDLISFMLGDLRERLAPVGRLDVLDAVGDKALEYFDSLSRDEVTDEEVLRRSKAMAQIGDVRMAQGNLAAAMEAFRESEALAESLVARNPRQTEWLANLGASRFWIGAVHWEQGALDATLEMFRSYGDIARELTALEPDNKDWSLELSYTHNNIGAVLDAKGDAEGAADEFRKSVDITRNLVAHDPENAAWAEACAEALSWLGSAEKGRGNLAGALETFQEELGMREALLSKDPDNTQWQERLGTSLNHVGLTLRARGDIEGSVQNLEKDLRIARRLVARDSANAGWRRGLAMTRLELGLALLDGARARDALEQFREGRRTLDVLVAMDPSNVDWRRLLAELHISEGLAHLAIGHLEGALASSGSALAALEPLRQSHPDDPDTRRLIAEHHLLRGRILTARGEDGSARDEWSKAVRSIEPVARGSNDVRLLVPWASALLHLDRMGDAEPVCARLGEQGYRGAGFITLCREREVRF